ncbi:MAG: hypothetical protein ACD_28C00257G0001, partial [uncultured bacterium]
TTIYLVFKGGLVYIDNPYEVYKNLQHTLESRKESLYSGRADMESRSEAPAMNLPPIAPIGPQ